jgi:hypothetical protein
MAKSWNPRYLAYCYPCSPQNQLALDRKLYPGGCMTGFILWVPARWREFDQIKGLSTMKHIGPPFWIYCDCGPNGTLHRVPALRVLHQARPSYPGQRRAKPSLRNMCRICEKLWPALPPSARKPRIEARVASYIEQRRAQWAEARQP